MEASRTGVATAHGRLSVGLRGGREYFPMLSEMELSAPVTAADPHEVRALRGATVSYYRIYMLDHLHRMVTGSDADCADDACALAWAATTLGNNPCAEIWQEDRCIGHVLSGSVSLDRRRRGAGSGVMLRRSVDQNRGRARFPHRPPPGGR
jgi:hypothetical protein